ncbi:MAG: UvrD-helicase domain-containing protein, partial [Candidatus Eisenbacteria bacterium]|nr:UvrD-helicase domain-containing protein [Candidatus Eisenbacteria bacterium]
MTKPIIIPDAEHRLLASGHGDGLRHTYLVEAGAGTGKTTVLVDRLLALIRAGARISRIVAITFTEKAAGELRVRLRGSLEHEIRHAPEQETDEVVLDRLIDAFHEIDRAQVSTIHGFCSNLLKERPVEAGVDPGFSVADELRRTLILDAVWDNWIRKQFAEQLPPAVAEAQSLGHGLNRIRELALHMVQNRDLLDLVPGFIDPPDIESLISDLHDAARSFAGLIESACSDPEDKALPATRDFIRQMQIAEDLPDGVRVSYVLRHVKPAPGRG